MLKLIIDTSLHYLGFIILTAVVNFPVSHELELLQILKYLIKLNYI